MESYALSSGQAGYDRLRVLARTRRASTLDLLHRAGLRAGMRCVDMGCGGGEGTFDIAELAGPEGQVVGIDIDEIKLALGREEAARRGLSNLEFVAASASDWDEPGGYDFVYSRVMLQHLGRRVEILGRMWKAVRPGGVLAVEDTDFGGLFCYPANDGFAFYKRMMPLAIASNGGDALFGLRLYQLFLDLGIPEPQLSLAQNVDASGESKTMSLLTLQSVRPAIVKAGLATEAEVDAATDDLAAFTAAPDTIMSGPRILQVWARKEMDENQDIS